MNRRYGVMAGIAAAAFAGWWWRRRRRAGDAGAASRGEVIYRNTPVPTNEGIL